MYSVLYFIDGHDLRSFQVIQISQEDDAQCALSVSFSGSRGVYCVHDVFRDRLLPSSKLNYRLDIFYKFIFVIFMNVWFEIKMTLNISWKQQRSVASKILSQNVP